MKMLSSIKVYPLFLHNLLYNTSTVQKRRPLFACLFTRNVPFSEIRRLERFIFSDFESQISAILQTEMGTFTD